MVFFFWWRHIYIISYRLRFSEFGQVGVQTIGRLLYTYIYYVFLLKIYRGELTFSVSWSIFRRAVQKMVTHYMICRWESCKTLVLFFYFNFLLFVLSVVLSSHDYMLGRPKDLDERNALPPNVKVKLNRLWIIPIEQ